jgi:hypothetical protein
MSRPPVLGETDMAKAVQKIKLSPSRDIPFNKLVLSQSNVRRVKAGISIEDLAEDIARRKLLQSLNVRPIVDADGQETDEDAIEKLVYDLLEQTYSGWEDNQGAYGDFLFHVAERTITLNFNEGIETSEYTQHVF